MIKKISVLILVIIIVTIAGSLLTSGKKKSMVSEPTVQSSPTVQQSTISQPEKQMTDTNITVTSSGFEPQTVTVKVGTKVIWTNKSGGFANVSSDPHPTHVNYPPLNLGGFADGKTVELVFDKPGTFKYHNHLDSSKTGIIIVE